MISLQDFLNTTEYQVTNGTPFMWDCYGENAYYYEHAINASVDCASILFDRKTLEVYEATVCDYINKCAYRLLNPKFKNKYFAEAKTRNESVTQAWDDINYIDLTVDSDFLEKAKAILGGKTYNPKIVVELELTPEEELQYMRAAHQEDITLNQFVENAIRAGLDKHNELNIDLDPL